MLAKLKLNTQLNFAFGAMILLLGVVSIVALFALNSGYKNFVEYRTNARDSNLSALIQSNVLTLRLEALKYLKDQNVSNINEFNNRHSLLTDLVETGKKQFTDPAKLTAINKISDEIELYKTGFDKLVNLVNKRNNIVGSVLDENGVDMRKAVTQLIQISQQQANFDSLLKASQLQESLLLGRLYVSKYLINNTQAEFERSIEEFDVVSKRVKELALFTNSPQETALVNEFINRTAKYVDGIDQIHKTIDERNLIITGTLDKIGPKVAAEIEEIKLNSQQRQDQIGPSIQSSNRNAINTIIIFSIIVIVLGIVLSIFISRLIKNPIGGEPLEIAKIVQAISEGDLRHQFDNTGKETGIYLAMKEMTLKLNQMLSQIRESTTQVSETSLSLTSITAESKTGAEQQSVQLTQTATAMDQMSATVNEITQSAQMAADAASNADNEVLNGSQVVSQTHIAMGELVETMMNVSQTIANLEAETESVGSILDVIRGIADQTNLLALNAAIEAARAGEQGRGFAVVADEVRSLASRTQQSTEEIQVMISNLQNEAKKSVESMKSSMTSVEQTAEKTEQTGEALDQISQSVGTIKDMNVQIASASEEQNVVSQQISESVQHVNEKAHETMAGAEQAANIANSLSQTANELDQIVKQFRVV
ncbi:methyl-accepting chemotaxis protein [Pseudoalteromonas sp. H105]|uniref:HAMP domain-containing methyl-accepting chemotaxis protein n=1 Tax=Pseudoalteromonas sp. H105 TaxID=1348393 RepID=UPI0007322726|nr:methyl-accepting chemotaxis protein [Pseudoalteromonas sp. H105]KTF13493.1 chemotaxis protein [Pseudoalteromonas sp. H105]